MTDNSNTGKNSGNPADGGNVELGADALRGVPDYSPTIIDGRKYTGHALERMDERGLVPSVVENTIDDSHLIGKGNKPNTLVYYDPENRIQVVTNYNGDVVTVIPGDGPKPNSLAPFGD